eukprot:gene8850-14297_t
MVCEDRARRRGPAPSGISVMNSGCSRHPSARKREGGACAGTWDPTAAAAGRGVLRDRVMRMHGHHDPGNAARVGGFDDGQSGVNGLCPEKRGIDPGYLVYQIVGDEGAVAGCPCPVQLQRWGSRQRRDERGVPPRDGGRAAGRGSAAATATALPPPPTRRRALPLRASGVTAFYRVGVARGVGVGGGSGHTRLRRSGSLADEGQCNKPGCWPPTSMSDECSTNKPSLDDTGGGLGNGDAAEPPEDGRERYRAYMDAWMYVDACTVTKYPHDNEFVFVS